MTQQTNPLYAMTIKASESLMQDIERSLAALQTSQVKTNTRFQNWKTMVKTPQDPQAACLGEAGMMGFFLDFLFGMPMFSGMSEMAKGMLQVGLMAHADQGRDQAATMPSMAALNALIASQNERRLQAVSGQKNQSAHMKKMRQMVMLMMLMMMQEDEQGGGGRGDTAVAPDVLRHPIYAQAKQNRHSMLENIRAQFDKERSHVVTPRFNVPRCEAA